MVFISLMNPLIVNSFFAGRSIFVGAKNRKRENKKNGFQQFIVFVPLPANRSFGILHPAKEMPEFRIIFVESRFLCVGRTGICGTHPAFYMCRLCGGTCGALF